MSYMTELRSKRDRSDTASLMTVDEITAEVESRRASMSVDHDSDMDEWTKVDSENELEGDTMQETPNEAAESEAEEEATCINDDDNDDDQPEAAVMRGGKSQSIHHTGSVIDSMSISE
jgi:mitogen-activated protein kinase kinase kinase